MPWRATCFPTTGCDCERGLCVCVGVRECVCAVVSPLFWFSLCLGCGDLYGVLVTPCVISISVMSISIAWGDWGGVASQMVQCQDPQVWFKRSCSYPLPPESCHLALPRCHLSSNRVKAELLSPRRQWPMSWVVAVLLFHFIYFF